MRLEKQLGFTGFFFIVYALFYLLIIFFSPNRHSLRVLYRTASMCVRVISANNGLETKRKAVLIRWGIPYI